MKKINAVMAIVIFLFFINSIAFCQDASETKASFIEPYRFAITFYKTTNLIFPYIIRSVDRGSRDILAQKVKGSENILQIKAGRQGFKETNLTVITADGKLYSFILSYADNPTTINIRFENTGTMKPSALFFSATNEAVVQAEAAKVAGEKRTVTGARDKKYRMKLQLEGLYIKDEVIYCQIQLENQSNINYDIGQFRFFIRDEKRSKRTAFQEIEIKPLYIYGDTSVIKGQSKNMVVFAFPRFTIPDKKFLCIQLMEKNGGRHLQLKVQNRTLVKATAL
jgi:conjugative transposon TraN protein